MKGAGLVTEREALPVADAMELQKTVGKHMEKAVIRILNPQVGRRSASDRCATSQQGRASDGVRRWGIHNMGAHTQDSSRVAGTGHQRGRVDGLDA